MECVPLTQEAADSTPVASTTISCVSAHGAATETRSERADLPKPGEGFR